MIDIELMRNPLPNETVIIRISEDTYDIETMSRVVEMVGQAFPNNTVLLLPDSIKKIESKEYGKYNSNTYYK